ncbi:YdcF family protein [Spiractinospora alimapuensis]|uniref:YdcF family protein n=1 Tax=Spiractinospora alimapuensis TaxID=2820884 RepID=UPI001F18043A|nr:YdcF family protein [Spiractinospora alimapuensis]QVQ51285.1 YdcF family protein [Spiractinospora alimapuensis]
MADELTQAEIAEITAFVDLDAPPPAGVPTALFMFGTNQAEPVDIVADRYHAGLAPLIIATGGVNRHDGSVEAETFAGELVERGVPEHVIRRESKSSSTWENVEFGLPYLREAIAAGYTITAVCKWYHRRTVSMLRTLLPDVPGFHVVTFEPVYGGVPITRTNWADHPHGRRRVLREAEEVQRRVSAGEWRDVDRVDGAWR